MRSVQSVVPGAFTAEEMSGEADLRLWVLRVDRLEVHISGAHPTLGSEPTGVLRSTRLNDTQGQDRDVPVKAARTPVTE